MKENILEECYEKSIELLLKNSTKFGFLASSESGRAVNRNYLSIFGRDASICAIGAVASKNKNLIRTAKNSILTLAKFQADNGQIPNYVKPEKGEVNFWKMGCIDSTLWWLIGVSFYDIYGGDKKLKFSLRAKIEKSINWLKCQEHPKKGILIQSEASDWADIMPRRGMVLYPNALWLKVKDVYEIKNSINFQENFNKTFYPFNNSKLDIKNSPDKLTLELLHEKKPTNFYLSFIDYLS